MKDFYFKALENIYRKLDEILLPAGIDCGKCCICCLNIREDTFTPLEIEYIYKNSSRKNREDFFYAIRENSICPFCDLTIGRCTIYNFRPLVCRRWGPFVNELYSYISASCVYAKKVHIFPPEKKEEVPFQKEFASLNKIYLENLREDEKNRIEKMRVLSEEEKDKKDIEDFERALKVSFHKAPILTLIGRAYNKLGNSELSAHYYTKAIEIDPFYDFVWYLKGLWSYNKKDFKRAEFELRKALEIYPENITVRAFLIMFYVGLWNYNAARKEIEYLKGIYPFILERYDFLKEL
ncbi:MAG TPA: YkgJ family cysteine cluster protein [Candidatus Eremiobacteraeota bacterium]|nr:MAG: Tetratricopeptide repeat protein [bacterium ADurb.Bin363]HPZ07858.1 YkgJ family cysteine cluster protein [Candidatus Eremiobacteraeota bacterium]